MAKQLPRRTMLTPPQLASEFGVSPAKVISWIRCGELPAIDVADSKCHRPRYLIDREDVDRFKAARRVVPDGGLSTTQRLRRRAAGDGTIKEFF